MPAEDRNGSSTWLLIRDSTIRRLFIGIFVIGFAAGALRFLFPFQILNLGGSESLASLGGTYSALGQVVGLVMISRLIRGKKTSLVMSGLLLAGFILATAFTFDSSILALSRLLEGAGSGLLAILIVRVSCEAEDCRGETVGTLLSAIFLGSAIGQGIAGITVEYTSQFLALTQASAIQVLALVLTAPAFAVLALMLPRIDEYSLPETVEEPRKHKHFHFNHLARALFSKKVILLAGVYFLYDFSHGFYTPVLSLLINNNGVPIDQIGLGYLTGDIVWGGMQLYAGRVVDRVGHFAPLVLSLIAKGVFVFFYAGVTSIVTLAPLLALAGSAEGFLEPARNDAAMAHSPSNGQTHDHAHYYLAHAPGAPFSLAKHEHEHTHETGSDEIVSVLQTVGIIGFAIGSGGGAWLLVYGAALSFLIVVGGFLLILAGLVSIGLYNKKQ
ncbi:MAG: MFS transporter [Candidatus Thorarchaeota archaeon]